MLLVIILIVILIAMYYKNKQNHMKDTSGNILTSELNLTTETEPPSPSPPTQTSPKTEPELPPSPPTQTSPKTEPDSPPLPPTQTPSNTEPTLPNMEPKAPISSTIQGHQDLKITMSTEAKPVLKDVAVAPLKDPHKNTVTSISDKEKEELVLCCVY